MQCPRCGHPVDEGSRFCPACGGRIATPPPDGATLSGRGTVAGPGPIHDGVEPGEVFANRYEIERLLGRGGMGAVYLARDRLAKERICLKVIRGELTADRSAGERFLREGALARRLSHRNIVRVFDVSEHEGRYYLTMEYLEGRSLRSWIEENRKADRDVPLEEATRILGGILSGLGEAHRAGVIHRDLKPENVMLAGEPHAEALSVKILDFGIARALGSDEGLTQTGAAVGTPAYMAPEQETSAASVGPEADLYAAGAILYEILMGVAPRGRWGVPSEVRPDLPKAIDGICGKALEAHPKRRFRTGEEFVEALRKAQGPAAPAEASPPALGKKRAPLVILGWLSAVAVCGGIVWMAIANSRNRSTPSAPAGDAGQKSAASSKRAAAPPAKAVDDTAPKRTRRAEKAVPTPTKSPAAPGVVCETPPAEPPMAHPSQVDLGGGVTLELVKIPAGEFEMGSPAGELERNGDEGPVHRVRIENPFWLGKFEVTHAEWQAVMGSRASRFGGTRDPVESVSWNDCQEFLKKLDARVSGGGFRLPTEAEWEYACRAGTATRFPHGDDPRCDSLGEYAWFSGNAGNQTHPVGERKANPWGLHDMAGNVWEWTSSLYRPYPYSAEDGREMLQGTGSRVLRGGSWYRGGKDCRSAARFRIVPGVFGDSHYGLRVARTIP